MRRAVVLLVLALAASLVAAGGAAADETVVSRARTLALGGQKAEALEMLRGYLASVDDSDARTLYGTVLSWEGRYDEARVELERVVVAHPGHGDALPALLNVELWSGHPDRAESLAREGLARRPGDTALLMAQARALKDLRRDDEALARLDQILRVAPQDKEARALQERIAGGRRVWALRLSHASDWFDDGTDPWRETSLTLKRRTGIGSVLGRYSRVRRFGLDDDLFEVEAYPHIAPRTYAFVGFGWAPTPLLYPARRFAVDVYRGLPGAFEVSLGYRRLSFDNPVDIYVGTLSRYWGSWLLTGRVFLTPDTAGASTSVFVSARRYIGDDSASYVTLRYGHGLSKDELLTGLDIAVLNSDSVFAEWNTPLGRRFELNLNGAWSREDRVARTRLGRYTAGADLGWRF